MALNFGSVEILQIAESVARSKSIPKEGIIVALEEGLKVAAKQKYGGEHTIKVVIDRNTGEIRIYKESLVVADEREALEKSEEDCINTTLLEDAKKKDADVAVGDKLYEPLPQINMDRMVSQSVKQVITAKIKEVERAREYEDFKGRIGEILSGVVEKIEYGGVIVKIGSTEAILRRGDLLKTDYYKHGERVRAVLVNIEPENKGPQLILSRTHNDFLHALCVQEIPEVADGIVEIRKVVRDPGSRAKIAVYCADKSISPVGACIGMRGSRIKTIINELQGEKIDVIEWSSDIGRLLVNALGAVNVLKVVVDKEQQKLEVVIAADQQSIAIGRRGQNVRLASELIDWKIDILTEEAESKRRQYEFNVVTQKFMEALDLEEILAQLLASEGFISIQELADSTVADLVNIQGIDEELAQALIERAKSYAQQNEDADMPIFQPYNAEMMQISGMTMEISNSLSSAQINSVSKVADLSRDEFKDLLQVQGVVAADDVIDGIIMDARSKFYNLTAIADRGASV